MVIVDTSVWIETFRAKSPLDLIDYVDVDEIVTCLPIVQEVLQGFRDERIFRRAREAMLSLPIVESPLTEQIVLEAVALYRNARRAGTTIRSSIDCLIAACAIRHDFEVLHRDRDYAALARTASLRQRSV